MSSKANKLAAGVLTAVTIISALSSGMCRSAEAAGMTDIRVGLTELYCGVESVTIYNDAVALGYCIGDSFRAEESFSGGGGFTFTAAAGYYYISDAAYGDYDSALRAAQEIRALGVEAYPAALYRGTWRVYASGRSVKAEAEKDYVRILKAGIGTSKASGDNMHRVLVTSKTGSFIIDGKPYDCYPQFKAMSKNKSGDYVINLGSRLYRGRIEIGRYGKAGLSAVNILNIEAYLASVVPCEMVSSWHMEALRAQAVCSRSYAVAKAGYGPASDSTKAYILSDTTASQVYKGYTYETSLTTEAVASTVGLVVRYKGSVIPAYFYSTSGGATENGMDVWGLTQECFTGVPDIYETAPERRPWIVKTTYGELGRKLSSKGYSIDTPDRVYAKITTASGRILELGVTSGGRSIALSSDEVRSVLGLPSAKARVVSYGGTPDAASARGAQAQDTVSLNSSYVISAGSRTTYLADTGLDQYIAVGSTNMMNFPAAGPEKASELYFAGMGYGHGVGMSQSGARGMAEEGYTFREIIEYYFSGAVCGY